MARISIVTIVYTVYLALFYMFCKGWSITIFQMNRNQATYLTMIMGTVYLVYSAYFLSAGITAAQDTMVSIMILLFGSLGVINVRSVY